MNNFFIKCHTLGVGPTAPVLAIAAVAFDPVANKIGSHTYIEVELASILKPAFLIDPEVLATWMGRSAQARAVFHKKPSVDRYSLATALDELRKFIGSIAKEPARAWGDTAVLEYAYRAGAIGLTAPWHNTNRLDVSALMNVCHDLFGMGVPETMDSGILDNLVAHATGQAQHICDMYAFMAKLKAGKPTKAKPVQPPVVDDDEL